MTRLNATELISYIDSSIRASQFTIETLRVDSNLVRLIRRYIRDVYSELYDAESDNSSASNLRLELFKLQSSPAIPSPSILVNCDLNDKERTKNRWGSDVANFSVQLERAIRLLNKTGSPLLSEVVAAASLEIKKFSVEQIKFWCHRNEREVFIELFEGNNIEISDKNFICSLSEYRETELFEVLIRIGPLRSQGWSKTPKVIVSAPRYKKLLQFVWDSTPNESEFFNDPVFFGADYSSIFTQQEKTVEVYVELDDITDTDIGEAVDDFVFISSRPINIKRDADCILIEFSEERGVLLAPRSRQFLFTREINNGAFIYTSAQAIESTGFLLLHDVEADLGGNKLNYKGKLAQLWKQSLSEMLGSQYQFLMMKMKSSGIDLDDLDSAARRWALTDEEGIGGPQSRRHFQILIEQVLPNCLGKYKWRRAWEEIKDSRVKAIQDGKLENVLINEQLREALQLDIDVILNLSEDGNFFSHPVNPESGLTGVVKFYPIIGVSSGFKASNEKLGIISRISDLELFRNDI